MANAISRFGLAVAISVGVVISASGQGRGFTAPMRGSSAPVRSFSGGGRGFAGSPRGTGTRPGVFRGGFAPPLVGTPLNPNFAPLRGVPGLGFDFEHLAAIQGPSRGRFGRGDRDRGGFFTPLFFGGLPLYYSGDYPYDNGYPYDTAAPEDYTGAAQQPPIFVVPQPQPNTSAPAEPAPRQAATPQAPPPPPPELGQLILVRSDGEVLLAVAFTVSKGRLTYITNEGAKRSFPVSELDKQATQQMNDANGTSVSLPE
jgi:hypothetical protein